MKKPCPLCGLKCKSSICKNFLSKFGYFENDELKVTAKGKQYYEKIISNKGTGVQRGRDSTLEENNEGTSYERELD